MSLKSQEESLLREELPAASGSYERAEGAGRRKRKRKKKRKSEGRSALPLFKTFHALAAASFFIRPSFQLLWPPESAFSLRASPRSRSHGSMARLYRNAVGGAFFLSRERRNRFEKEKKLFLFFFFFRILIDGCFKRGPRHAARRRGAHSSRFFLVRLRDTIERASALPLRHAERESKNDTFLVRSSFRCRRLSLAVVAGRRPND